MDIGQFKSIVSALRRYALTEGEKHFVDLAEVYFAEKGVLNEEQKSVLEGIYREKKKWGKIIDPPEKEFVKNPALP